jgi:enoyl-[acyl-carrier protein] reductase II
MKNRITAILGTKYPLIQGPMRLMSLGEMAAAVSGSGGFGQIAASGASAELLRGEIAKARRLTDKPFGVNISLFRPNALEALEIAIEAGLRTITTSAGNPAKVMGRIRENGLKVLHKVSTLDMALKAQDAGVDGVIATGYEAGGHIGRGEATTFCLVPQLADALSIPVVAAGGIGDARGFLAALALGAEGVEMGTRFVATRECPAPDFNKRAILEAGENSTLVLGKEMPLRVLRSRKALEMADPERARAASSGRGGDDAYVQAGGGADEVVMPAGQVAGLIRAIVGAGEVFPEMVLGARALAGRLETLFKEET